MRFFFNSIFLIVLFITAESSYSQAGPDEKFDKLGIVLPVKGSGNQYVNITQVGSLIYLSGKGPLKSDGSYVTGKLGDNMTIKEGVVAARLCALHQLGILKQELGSLSRIKKIVKVTGFINSNPDFTDQPEVMDGFSSVMNEIFGESGKHARSAVGVASLPFGWAVEAEMIVELKEEE